ncbi:MAG: SBBP repeat-containing protein [Bacteroidota bacterium]
MKKNIILIFSAAWFCIPGVSQTPSWQWATGDGGLENELVLNSTTDASGISFAVGVYKSPTITIGTYSFTNMLSNASTNDIFIVKYDASGNVLWAKSAGGRGNDYAYGVTADTAGNIYVAGGFGSDTAWFGSTVLVNADQNGNGGEDTFLAKYDPNGNLIWIRKSAGNSFPDYATTVAMDPAGNICIAGTFGIPQVTFGSYTLNTYLSWGGANMYVVKYDPSGNVLWAKGAGGGRYDKAYGVTTDASGNIYVTGAFESTSINFGTGSLTNTNQSQVSGTDVFLVKYNSSGTTQWARKGGGMNTDYGRSVKVDPAGDIVIGGDYLSTSIGFGTTIINNTPPGGFDAFLVKYNSAGTVVWVRAITGGADEYYHGMVIDLLGNIYSCGSFGSATAASGPVTLTNSDASNYYEDLYILKHTASGTASWGVSAGGQNRQDVARGIDLDATGGIYVAGNFASPSVPFGSTTLTNTFTGPSSDLFIARLGTTTGRPDPFSDETLIIYPNPCTGYLNITGLPVDRLTTITMFNAMGSPVAVEGLSTTATGDDIRLDLYGLPAGIYLIYIHTGDETHVRKLIKH